MKKKTPKIVERQADYAVEEDTRIEMAGVVRCCHATVAQEYIEPEKKRVALGATSACLHCKLTFTLVWCDRQQMPIWKPDWQLEEKGAKS